MYVAMSGRLWGGLPVEIIERVLSFLPLPVLCRFRCVCKRWKSLVAKPSFHDLCDMNGRKGNYLFITRYVIYSDWCYVDPSYMRKLSFLDLEDQRWYTIGIAGTAKSLSFAEQLQFEIDSDTRLLAMDDGLLCDLTGRADALPGTPIVVFDPVSRKSRSLRAPPTCCPTDALPTIAMVADNATRSYRVFFVNNCAAAQRRMYVYESASNRWRALKNPPATLGITTALSAVFFRGALYIAFQTHAWNMFEVLSYNLQEDTWRRNSVSVPEKPSLPQLVAHDDRLFFMVWSFNRFSAYHLIEILVPENVSKRVLEISTESLHEFFDEEIVDIAYGIPLFDSTGIFSSVILVSSLSGKTIKYNSLSGAVEELPGHPLRPDNCLEDEDDLDFDGLPVTATYTGKHMNLNLRNLLP